MGDNSEKRILYVDQLRALSILWLIFINVAFIFRQQSIGTLEEYIIYSSFGFGVPIFLMILGMLMLDRDYSDLNNFFKSRFVRILVPFLIWNTMMAVIATITQNHLGFNMKFLIYIFQNFMLQHWYAWMLLGIYLSLPIFSEYIRSKKVKGAEYFLFFAILASLIYQLMALYHTPSYFNLTFFIGPIIYLFLGYYFENKKFNTSSNKLFLIGVILFILTSSYIVYYDIFVNHLTMTIFLHHYNFYTHSYMDVSLIVIAQAVGMFLIFKYLNRPDNTGIILSIQKLLSGKRIKRLTTSLSRSCYGVYLTHQSIILILASIFNLTAKNEVYGIPLIAISTLIISWLIILSLKKLKVPTQYIGYD